MKIKFLLTAGIIAIITGCGNNPQLEVNNLSDKNISEEVKDINNSDNKVVEQIDENEKLNTQSDLVDSSTIKVDESTIKNNVFQQLEVALSTEVVYFDFDKYSIRTDQMPVIKKLADLLKNTQQNFTLRIEGNCDEWGSDEYNYALGLKRAKTIKQVLTDLGVDSNKLTIISYGESNPVCTEHTKSCWAKNRRVNFTLLP